MKSMCDLFEIGGNVAGTKGVPGFLRLAKPFIADLEGTFFPPLISLILRSCHKMTLLICCHNYYGQGKNSLVFTMARNLQPRQ